MAKFTAQVRGGLHANYSTVLGSIEPFILINDHRRAAQTLAHKGDFEARALMNALLGAVPGSNVTLNYAEIVASPELGGARPVQNVALINRNTTAGDVTDLKTEIGALSTNTFVPSPVYNGDRNPLGTR